MANVDSSLKNWSTTESANAPAGATTVGAGLDDNLRMIQAVVRQLAANDTIASAGTCDLGSKDAAEITITGTTTITGFGTVSVGIWKILTFSGALTLTHNATSLILPTGANITTAAGDNAIALSLGSGNWRVISYQKASGEAVKLNGLKVLTFTRDMTLASGAQSVTGAGFTPRAGVVVAAQGGGIPVSVGVFDATADLCVYNYAGAIAGTWNIATVYSISMLQTTANIYSGEIAPAADGITINWTKTGSPTGTLTAVVLLFR